MLTLRRKRAPLASCSWQVSAMALRIRSPSASTGLGGALFQSVSGLTLKALTVSGNYTAGYNALFYMFGAAAFIGLFIMLFLMGPLVKNKELEEYVKK
jgi:ACS family hexuronate transporter-like MFS transporter